MRVLITSNSFGKFDQVPRQKMIDLGWELIENRYHHIMDEQEMMEEVVDVDAILLGSDCVNKQVLEKANRLKIISRYGVGLDNVDLEEAKRRNIQVTITKNCNTEAVADYTIGLMLATARHITNVDQHLKKGQWRKETGIDLCHKCVGVIGLGAIGRQVIQRLQGFGCSIIGYDANVDKRYCEEHNVRIGTLDELCKEADIITLHIPGKSDGSHVINKRELDFMKPNTIIINTARASLLHEEDIIEALSNHTIYGYGTDVFVNEPHIHPRFQTLDNVVLSPHNAAVSVEAINQMSHTAVEHLIAYFKEQ